MSGSGADISLRIGFVDQASESLSKINQSIAKLQKPAKASGSSLAKLGETSGLRRITEGMATFGDTTLGAARSVERMVSPMATLTSAASIAGMIELSRQWGQMGNTVNKTAYAMNMPVERLGALRGAARLAGSSADAMDSSLQGLQNTLSAANFNQPGAQVGLLNQLGISFRGLHGEARNADQALGDVAESIKGMTPHAQARTLGQLGMSPDLLPLLKNGRAGLEEFRKQAMQTGGVMTGQMSENAKKMNASWTELGMAVEGVNNRMWDSMSGFFTKTASAVAKFIEDNPKIADSYAKVGAAASVAMAALVLKTPSLWVLRALGLATLAETATMVGATVGMPLALAGDTDPRATSEGAPGWAKPGGFLGAGGAADRFTNRYIFGPLSHGLPFSYYLPGGGGARSGISAPRPGSAGAGVMQRMHDYFRGKGLTEEQTAGVLANAAAESDFNPDNLTQDSGGPSYGLFQYHLDRLTKLRAYAGSDKPTEQQQLDFTWQEMQQRGVLAHMPPHDAVTSGAVFSRQFEVPAGGAGEDMRRGNAASQFVSGHVTVDVNLHNAPPGTTAAATAAGAASAAPPRVNTGMAYMGGPN